MVYLIVIFHIIRSNASTVIDFTCLLTELVNFIYDFKVDLQYFSDHFPILKTTDCRGEHPVDLWPLFPKVNPIVLKDKKFYQT